MTNQEVLNIDKIFSDNNLHIARMVGGSKSLYREKHRDNEVYFNANIFTLNDGKIWHGDLDITLDREKLNNVAKKLKKELYILSEMDGRFENETLEKSFIKNRSKVIILHHD